MHSTAEEVRLDLRSVSYKDRGSKPLPTREQQTEHGVFRCRCEAYRGSCLHLPSWRRLGISYRSKVLFPPVYWPMQVRLESSNQPIVPVYPPETTSMETFGLMLKEKASLIQSRTIAILRVGKRKSAAPKSLFKWSEIDSMCCSIEAGHSYG